MSKDKTKTAGRIKPTDVPEAAIEKLAVTLGIDADVALDFIVFAHDEILDSDGAS